MPDVLHSTLSTTELHEPKGADSATANQVYIADGSGSGTWTTWPFGWGFYQHNVAGQVFNTTASKLEIDGAGSATSEAYLPQGGSSLWDTTNDKILPMAVGDMYMLRIAIPIASKTASPTVFTLKVDIGGGATPTTVISTRDISTANTAPFSIQIAFPVFIGSTALTNGIQLFGSTNTGSVTLATGAEILINRIYGDL